MNLQIENNNFEDYENLYTESPISKVFNSVEWLNNFGDINTLTIRSDKKVLAGVCYIQTNKFRINGNHCPPFTPYYHPIFTEDVLQNRTIQNKVLNFLLNKLNSLKVNDFICKYSDMSIHPFSWNGYNISMKISTVINCDKENWIKSINKNKLRDIKKLEELISKNEIFIKFNCDHSSFEEMIKNTEKLKKFSFNPIYKKLFFDKRNKNITGNVVVFSKNGVPLNGICYALDKRCIYNLINVSNKIKNNDFRNCNYLIMYELILKALYDNKSFDFEGSMLKGVEEFYRYMGGEQIPVVRFIKSKSVLFNSLQFMRTLKNSLK